MPSPRRNPLHDRLRMAPPPDADTPMRACSKCLGVFYDCANGRDAHQVVFGHQPATPSQEADS